MRQYFRIMLGRGSRLASECIEGGFIGANYEVKQDISGRLPDDVRSFNTLCVPIFLESHPGKSKVSASLSCGALWTVCKGARTGDVVLCPDGGGRYVVGEFNGEYEYHPGGNLPHRRPVTWYKERIDREDMSQALKNSCGIIGTVCNITKFKEEIDRLLETSPAAQYGVKNEIVEDLTCFALERHLEDFLVDNWEQTELGKDYDLVKEDGELVGRQFQTDTGAIDLLAISKDGKTLLVVELKRGRASDAAVGQVLRYMGFVRDELAEEGQQTKGTIIALEDDARIRRALAIVPDVDFYRYQVSFKLLKA
ncbi:DUF1016 family protein [Pseudodesulfovibrio sp. F-1]|uniref:DUF1016 family protein n=1 Tax=Pseudodesulfovibrio alkaliphilus TaxID=2661613 RepID=A0A7K1KMU3_9BACT|nr:endonuclease NucS domain-containing protein [Pseudodesulfovibrio alkaliphilus]MUM77347.1 DUF1016 family protein [Pseudodesulfovibrio alkaliphilus]